MKSFIIEALISLLFVGSGIFFLLTGSSHMIQFISGGVLLLVGLILIALAIKSLIKYLTEHTKEQQAVETVVVKSSNLIARNDEMIGDWNKTNESRDKLKILQMQAGVEEGK